MTPGSPSPAGKPARGRLRVLLVHLEYPLWVMARHWSYTAQLGLEHGLAAADVDFQSVTVPCFQRRSPAAQRMWMSRIMRHLGGSRYDQVWLEVVQNEYPQEFWPWLLERAPVRLGMMAESLVYGPGARRQHAVERPEFLRYLSLVPDRLKLLTHALAADETDADRLNLTGPVPALWWVTSVPEAFVMDIAPPQRRIATFCGAIYKDRAAWLRKALDEGTLVQQLSSEKGTIYPEAFGLLHLVAYGLVLCQVPGLEELVPSYMSALRAIRQRCFARWLKSLQTGAVVVNLPAYFGGYPGRVFEAMAAGRPVVTWRVPGRPRLATLFCEGEEILRYDSMEELGECVSRLLNDTSLAKRVSEQAQKKLLRSHTTERRVREILDWIETNQAPVY